ncbi:MAG: RNA polymerase sigma factor [Fluviicola sp.]|nr:RNA polymerase sigma factor [Fluviicola sp.]
MKVTVRYFINEEDRMSVVNNSFIKIIDKIEHFKQGTNYNAWIKRITYNEVINFYRKEKKYKSFLDFEIYDSKIETHSNTEEDYNASLLEESEILKLIHQLPSATRIVFDMYIIEGGFSYKDISKTLNISTETVKWHLKQARKQLKEKINKYELRRQTN